MQFCQECFGSIEDDFLLECGCFLQNCLWCIFSRISAQEETYFCGIKCPVCRKQSLNVIEENSILDCHSYQQLLVKSGFNYLGNFDHQHLEVAYDRINNSKLKEMISTYRILGYFGNITFYNDTFDCDYYWTNEQLSLEISRLECKRLRMIVNKTELSVNNSLHKPNLTFGPLCKLVFSSSVLRKGSAISQNSRSSLSNNEISLDLCLASNNRNKLCGIDKMLVVAIILQKHLFDSFNEESLKNILRDYVTERNLTMLSNELFISSVNRLKAANIIRIVSAPPIHPVEYELNPFYTIVSSLELDIGLMDELSRNNNNFNMNCALITPNNIIDYDHLSSAFGLDSNNNSTTPNNSNITDKNIINNINTDSSSSCCSSSSSENIGNSYYNIEKPNATTLTVNNLTEDITHVNVVVVATNTNGSSRDRNNNKSCSSIATTMTTLQHNGAEYHTVAVADSVHVTNNVSNTVHNEKNTVVTDSRRTVIKATTTAEKSAATSCYMLQKTKNNISVDCIASDGDVCDESIYSSDDSSSSYVGSSDDDSGSSSSSDSDNIGFRIKRRKTENKFTERPSTYTKQGSYNNLSNNSGDCNDVVTKYNNISKPNISIRNSISKNQHDSQRLHSSGITSQLSRNNSTSPISCVNSVVARPLKPTAISLPILATDTSADNSTAKKQIPLLAAPAMSNVDVTTTTTTAYICASNTDIEHNITDAKYATPEKQKAFVSKHHLREVNSPPHCSQKKQENKLKFRNIYADDDDVQATNTLDASLIVVPRTKENKMKQLTTQKNTTSSISSFSHSNVSDHCNHSHQKANLIDSTLSKCITTIASASSTTKSISSSPRMIIDLTGVDNDDNIIHVNSNCSSNNSMITPLKDMTTDMTTPNYKSTMLLLSVTPKKQKLVSDYMSHISSTTVKNSTSGNKTI